MQSSQVDPPVVIPVIDVTPPTIKLQLRRATVVPLGTLPRIIKRRPRLGTRYLMRQSIYVDAKVGEATADTAGRYTFQLSK